MKNEIIIEGEHYRLKKNEKELGCGVSCALFHQCLQISTGNKGLCYLFSDQVMYDQAPRYVFEKKEKKNG